MIKSLTNVIMVLVVLFRILTKRIATIETSILSAKSSNCVCCFFVDHFQSRMYSMLYFLYLGNEMEKGRNFCSEVRLPYGIGGDCFYHIHKNRKFCIYCACSLYMFFFF